MKQRVENMPLMTKPIFPFTAILLACFATALGASPARAASRYNAMPKDRRWWSVSIGAPFLESGTLGIMTI